MMHRITVSIVNHGHDEMIDKLLIQLEAYNRYLEKVIVTHNVPGELSFPLNSSALNISVLRNRKPLGFGANHNQAFKYCDTEYFCIMNPDIEINNDPFEPLLSCADEEKDAIIAPVIKNIEGLTEDSARYFPTPLKLLKKVFRFCDEKYPINEGELKTYPEWVGGMFMLVNSDKFRNLSGFDESYFLYYEDVDLCLRAWRHGYRVALCSNTEVIHDARRASHRSMRFLVWHITSAVRFFIKHLWRFPKNTV